MYDSLVTAYLGLRHLAQRPGELGQVGGAQLVGVASLIAQPGARGHCDAPPRVRHAPPQVITANK